MIRTIDLFQRRLATLAICVTCLAMVSNIVGCSRVSSQLAEQPVPKVTVMEVVSQQTVDADEYIGQTAASEIVEVRSRVFGYMKSVDFQDGDYVTEGQTLFTIEPDEYEAIHQQSLSRVELQAANLELAKAKFARQESLLKLGAVSQEEWEEARAGVLSSTAMITSAKADANRTAIDLKYTVLKSPISGRIDRAFITKGNLLTGGMSSGTLLTKIVNEQPMHVYFDVDEKSLLRYMRQRSESRESSPGSLRTLGLACFVQLADEKEFMHEGQLDFASSEVDSSTGTARIRGVFANEDRSLVSGLFVRVRVPVSEPYQALLIPEQALARDQNLRYVFIVDQNSAAVRRDVELGAQRGDLRIISSGLQLGDRVVVKGLQRIKPGQKVEAETVQPTLPPSSVSPPEKIANEMSAVELPPTDAQSRPTTQDR